jgi:hypothetical protein
MRTRTLRGALVAGLLLILPATAHAATATISNAEGADVPLGSPTTVDTMAPVLKVTFADSEKRYAVKVTGPAGTDAVTPVSCRAVNGPGEFDINYQGNGNYTVAITTSASADDLGCTGGQTNTVQFAIAATASATPPKGLILTRRPAETDLIPHPFKLSASAGADIIEIQYARGVQPQEDGSLPGTVSSTSVRASAGSTSLSFDKPGTWTVVARPRLGDAVGPWSEPLSVDVKAPFDLVAAPTFKDGRGPKYVLKGDVVESLPKGAKIKTLIAPGRKGGKFAPLKTIKTKRNGHFTLKFTLDKPGRYRIRYRFKGNERIAAGRVTQTIKVAKVVL